MHLFTDKPLSRVKKFLIVNEKIFRICSFVLYQKQRTKGLEMADMYEQRKKIYEE